MAVVTSETDINVVIDMLSFSEHIAQKINKANSILRLIKTFVWLDEEISKPLYVVLGRPHSEYANQVWRVTWLKI